MGCFDSVMVKCPSCGVEAEFQSKGGKCMMSTYRLHDAPIDVLSDVNRHAPITCRACGTRFMVLLAPTWRASVPVGSYVDLRYPCTPDA